MPLAGNCQISKSGGLFAQGPDPIGRRQAERLAKMRNRTWSEVLKAKQHPIWRFADLPDGLDAPALSAFLIQIGRLRRSVVRKLRRRIEEHDLFPLRLLRRLPRQPLGLQPLAIVGKCLLRDLVLSHRFLGIDLAKCLTGFSLG